MRKPRIIPQPNPDFDPNESPDSARIRAEFAKRLAKALSVREMRPAELARRAGFGRDSISTYLNAKTIPTAMSLQKLAAALDMDEEDLMPGSKSEALQQFNEPREFEIVSVGPKSPLAWLKVNKTVSLETAYKVVGLLMEDDKTRERDDGSTETGEGAD